MDVGKSSRTPYKHWLLNSHLGKLLGATATGKTTCERSVVIFDLCAGDGDDQHGPCSSSPSIIRKHLTSPLSGNLRLDRREAYLYEHRPSTFERLKQRHDGVPYMHLFNQDSREADLSGVLRGSQECVFVYADPNHADSIPLTPRITAEFTPFTLCMMTLGCNVGGVKRLPREQREVWYEKVDALLDRMSPYHDAHLIWLNRDSSQWAYFITLPKKWSEDMLHAAITAGTAFWPGGVSGVSARQHPKQLRQQLHTLFQTKEENSIYASA